MKWKTILLLIFALLIILSACRAAQPPQPPCILYGYVYVGGKAAQDGLTVTAVISGTTLNWTTRTAGGTYGWPAKGSTKFSIPTDTGSSSTRDGGSTGDSIVFYIQGVMNVRTAPFQPATPVEFDLSVPEISGGPESRRSSVLTATLDPSAYEGDKVDVSGRLAFTNGTGIGGAGLSLEYMRLADPLMNDSGTPWASAASATTSSNGGYLAQWTPATLGNFLVKVSWEGNLAVEGSEANLALALASPEAGLVFSVVSNSTVSGIAYNSTTNVLSFTLDGPNGTTGYTNLAVPKNLIENITTGLTVHLDQDTANYTSTSYPAFWMLHFTYTHSTHIVTVNLPVKPAPTTSPNFLETPIGILTLAVALAFAAGATLYITRGKIRQANEKPKKPLPKRSRAHRRSFSLKRGSTEITRVHS